MRKPFEIIKNKPLRSYFRHQWYNIHNIKKNMISLTTGGSGDGKSWATIIHNYFLDPRFDLDKIVWNEKQFYDALDNIKYVGEYVMWDEAGVGIPAKEWYKISNKAIGKTLQIFRADTRIGLTFTTQDMSFIDSQSRKLLNYFFMMQKRTSPKESTMWCREIMVNRYQGKMYMPYPRLRIDGRRYRFKNMKWDLEKIRKIPDLYDLLKNYDKKSTPIKRKIRHQQKMSVEKYIADQAAKEESNIKSKYDVLLDIKRRVLITPQQYLNVSGYFDADMIRAVESISRNDAVAIKKLLDKDMTVPDDMKKIKQKNQASS